MLTGSLTDSTFLTFLFFVHWLLSLSSSRSFQMTLIEVKTVINPFIRLYRWGFQWVAFNSSTKIKFHKILFEILLGFNAEGLKKFFAFSANCFVEIWQSWEFPPLLRCNKLLNTFVAVPVWMITGSRAETWILSTKYLFLNNGTLLERKFIFDLFSPTICVCA